MLETRHNTDVDILADKLRDNDIHDYEEVEEEDEDWDDHDNQPEADTE